MEVYFGSTNTMWGNMFKLRKRYLTLTSLVLFVTFLVIGVSSCIVEKSAHLNIENRISSDLNIVFNETFQNGQQSVPYSLGVAISGNTVQMRGGIILGGIASDKQITLQGKDSSTRVVWQKTWIGADFVKLKDVGWKIVVSPETSDPLTVP